VDLYSRKQRWKLVLAAVALLLVGASLWYSNRMVERVRAEERRKVQLWAEAVQNRAELVNYTQQLFDRLREEERKKVQLWAEAMNRLVTDESSDLSFYLKVVSDNTTVPVIITDAQGRVKFHRNVDEGIVADPALLKAEVEAMAELHDPLPIAVVGTQRQFLYYKDSKVFTELQEVMEGIIRSFISETVMSTAAVPVIYTDSSRTHIIEHSNIEPEIVADSAAMQERLRRMSEATPPILVDLPGKGRNYIHYEESLVITQLRYFPYVQLAILGLFLLVAYALFSIFRNAEQNQVWVGMAKETAHQLGTPLSAILAWIEYLRAQAPDHPKVLYAADEIARDAEKLDLIADRFSKIGAKPELTRTNVVECLERARRYMEARSPRRVRFLFPPEDAPAIPVMLNAHLFEWVLENLMRNALDAMEGEGEIKAILFTDSRWVHLEISDTGKGIPSSRFRRVFKPGYTTKTRGWGLGLSLAKRIVESYHSGRIFVKQSAPGKGTTFAILLPRKD